ncbi:MmyB family transcriptional regulator [Streptomyces massasporeus]|uniref:MmyB family transcriptional regulator n=1 Tax=Streptomyces massasporeus TaxID=67324 RepID=UPI001992F6F7|nr:transcriptional regulator [Streptomyces massasporeus]
MQRGKPLPQKEVAQRMEVSERWYRNLESNAGAPLTPEALIRLSTALALGPDERLALYRHVHANTKLGEPEPDGPEEARSALTHLLATHERYPAYIVDHAWNMLDCTDPMADWFPWVREPEANLLRWALTAPEAREQLTDWPRHAALYLAQLRFALVSSRDNRQLGALLDEVLADPECRRLWDEETKVVAYRQGHRFRLRLPHVSAWEITVTSQVLLPAHRQELRYVLLLPESDPAPLPNRGERDPAQCRS